LTLPSDHYEAETDVRDEPLEQEFTQPRLGFVGTLRWFWRQLTSMRTALLLLLLLALAAVPGSLVPQRSSDPNGVTDYFTQHPELAPILDKLQLFDVYSSVWFSAIYILLFVSLVGCVIPRTKHHIEAMLAKPPRTPARLSRMPGYQTRTVPASRVDAGTSEALVASAGRLMRKSGYRVTRYDLPRRSKSVSAERGYLRETGNLIFHFALLGAILAVGVGNGFGYTGQKIVVVGQSFVNNLASYNSINPGRFFNSGSLSPFSVRVDKLSVSYDTTSANALGDPLNYTAYVKTTGPGPTSSHTTIKVNDPLEIGGTQVYLLGNGYAPTVTVRNPEGQIVFQDSVPFLPQDANNTSIGVIKVPDGLAKQVGLLGFFYPTAAPSSTKGAMTSKFPGLENPLLSLNVYVGDLGLNKGVPVNVYSLDTDKLTQLSGPGTGKESLQLKPGHTEELPDGLGSVTLNGVPRYATLTIHHDPAQVWLLVFAFLILGGLLTSLFIPRRRMWVKVIEHDDGSLLVQYAALARGDDPKLDAAVTALVEKHSAEFTGFSESPGTPGLPENEA
jgi:cytochrome c biogenesis protein